MQDLQNLDKGDENIMLDANECILTSKVFMVFCLTDSGDFKTLSYCKGLNEAEFLGFHTYVSQITSQIIENKTELNLPQPNVDDEIE